MEIDIPKPELFDELCRMIGLSLMVGQKLQFAYAHYYAIHSKIERGLDDAAINSTLKRHLKKPMGVVVSDIRDNASFPKDLSVKISEFKEDRNWLAHDLDQEIWKDIIQNKNLDLIIDRLRDTMGKAVEIMDEVNHEGDLLMARKGVSAEEISEKAINKIKSIANQSSEPT